MTLVNMMFCASKVLRTPGTFQRVLMAVDEFVFERLVIIDCRKLPPNHAFVCESKLILQTNGWDPDDADLVELVGLANGDWSNDDQMQHLCSTCHPDRVCTKEDRLAGSLASRALFYQV